VVEIPGIDAQACAGTHVASTGALQAIKVLRTERIQDGVERIEFSAGKAAVAAAQAERKLLEQAATALGVPLEQVADAAGKLMGERKELRTRVATLEKELAEGRAGELVAERIGSVDLYINDCGEAPLAEMQELARRLSANSDALVLLATCAGGKGHVMATRGSKVEVDCGALTNAAAKASGGSGGGAPTHAQGAVPTNRANEALDALVTAARKALGK
ncbi:MAG: DHHA1 domain-containing protein, partial [Candidatus Thermoplasmatota archaeon]|nr:DHHA1 domain-containing protein [Candidatus Thermoplasmatota archaeon]